MELSKLTVIELKALKSDQYELLAQAQQNLQILNEEVKKRESEEPPKASKGNDRSDSK